LFHLSGTAWTEFCIIGNFVSLWLHCNFKFIIGLMTKLKSPTWFFVTVFMLTLLFLQEWHCTMWKVAVEKLHLLQYVCAYSAGVVVCMFMHEYANQPALTLKFLYYFLSSVGCSIGSLTFSCLER
jgi:hypothetical protein